MVEPFDHPVGSSRIIRTNAATESLPSPIATSSPRIVAAFTRSLWLR
ncbi:hypothetical protein [Microbacterium foliorum]|nr:hypothetical protein [Microbacterium foliorum]